MFLLLFVVGFVGFLAMAVLGMHHGGASSHSHTGHALPGHGHAQLGHGHHLTHTDGAHHDAGHGHTDSEGDRAFAIGTNVLSLLSPLHLFAFAMGAGATGLLLSGVLVGAALVAVAVGGALVFDFALIRPMMGFLLRFAGTPSEGLEGTVAHAAQAVTGFDDQGRGLVTLTLDGQNVQLLAQLDPAENHRGIRVHKGDEVVVLAVDPSRNTCRVTRELT